jgi:hypothetical protein
MKSEITKDCLPTLIFVINTQVKKLFYCPQYMIVSIWCVLIYCVHVRGNEFPLVERLFSDGQSYVYAENKTLVSILNYCI